MILVKKYVIYAYFLIISLFLISCQGGRDEKSSVGWIAECPAGSEYTHIDKAGVTVLPNGRFITPYGRTVSLAPHPYGLTLSPDNNVAVTANSGTSPLSITIIRNVFTENPEIQQIPEGAETDEGILESVFMGLAIDPGNEIVYVAGGQDNKIYIFRLKDGVKLDFIDCSVKNDSVDFTHGYIGDLILTRDGKWLYGVDQINFRMVIVNTQTKQLTNNVKVGRYPFGICLSPDEKEVYVANVGMYEYKWIPGIDPDDFEGTALKHPPFAYLSEESIKGIKTDSLEVPGLGDPNVPESFSVWSIDLEKMIINGKIKTGFLVGQKLDDFPAVGGSSPNSLVATHDYIFVSNGNNDCISVIDRHKKILMQYPQQNIL